MKINWTLLLGVFLLPMFLNAQVLVDHSITTSIGVIERYGDHYYQTGIFGESITVGIGEETVQINNSGSQNFNIYLVKYDLDYNVVWAEAVRNENNFRELKMDFHDDWVYLFWGRNNGSFVDHNCLIVNAEDPEEKYNIFTFKTGPKNTSYNVKISDNGSIAVVGEVRDKVVITAQNWSEEYLNSASEDIFVINYNALSGWVNYSHHLKRGHGYPGINDRTARAMKFDRNNQLHIFGKVEGSVQLTTNSGPVLVGNGAFHLGLDLNGNPISFEKVDTWMTHRNSEIVTLEEGYAMIGLTNYAILNEDFEVISEVEAPYYGNNEIQDIALTDSSITVLVDVDYSTVFGPGSFEIFENVNIPNGNDYAIVDMDFKGKLNWYSYFGGESRFNYPISLNYLENGNLLVVGNTRSDLDIDPSIDRVIVKDLKTDNMFISEYAIRCEGLNLNVVDKMDVTCTSAGELLFEVLGGVQPIEASFDGASFDISNTLEVPSKGVFAAAVVDGEGCSKEIFVPVSGPEEGDDFDLSLLHYNGEFRTGFDTYYKVQLSNKNCIPASGYMDIYLDNLIEYQGSGISPNSIDGQKITYNFEDLVYLDQGFDLKMDLRISQDAPFGEEVCVQVNVYDNNGDLFEKSIHCVEVVNSYDPNDISVIPYGRCDENYFLETEELKYLIRFQNLGNAEAINVEILDVLDMNFDIKSIEVLESSHEVMSYIEEDSILVFKFPEINLPAEEQDEEGSNGFVFFKVKANAGLPVESLFDNQAAIYFDYNNPVITNVVRSTLIDVLPSCVLSDVSETILRDVKMYPNPVSDKFTIEAKSGLEHIEVFDVNGRLILTQDVAKNHSTKVNVTSLKSGLYYIKIKGIGYRFYKL